ncbi:MAG: hypothetical protein HRU34_16540 [Richelia sp.]|nr:hypothetical protein [Richelia sp.]CDN16082.1 hypothetical protein RintRC_3625 [Richelia intracellularis]
MSQQIQDVSGLKFNGFIALGIANAAIIFAIWQFSSIIDTSTQALGNNLKVQDFGELFAGIEDGVAE